MRKLYLLVFATPTISTHGPRLLSRRNTLADRILTGPVALARASSFTTATLGASAESVARNPRPLRIGRPIVSK